MTGLLVVLVVLAQWRLARLLAVDEVSRPLRERVARRAPDGALAYLVTCPWCISVWSGWAVVVPVVFVVGVVDPWLWAVLLVLVGSLVSGFGQTVEDRLDR